MNSTKLGDAVVPRLRRKRPEADSITISHAPGEDAHLLARQVRELSSRQPLTARHLATASQAVAYSIGKVCAWPFGPQRPGGSSPSKYGS